MLYATLHVLLVTARKSQIEVFRKHLSFHQTLSLFHVAVLREEWSHERESSPTRAPELPGKCFPWSAHVQGAAARLAARLVMLHAIP